MKKLMSLLLAGAAVVALSGCSDKVDNSIGKVDIEALQTGYAITFEPVEENGAGSEAMEVQEVTPEEFVYKFCEDGEVPSAAEPLDVIYGGNYEKYNTVGDKTEYGKFSINGEDVDFRGWITSSSAVKNTIVPASYDTEYSLYTNGVLEVGTAYQCECNPDLLVKKIEEIECELTE